MRSVRLETMTRGWFVGDFEPTLARTQAVEVAVQQYPADAYEARHFHKIATEITVIVSGTVEMNGQRYVAGDIIVIEPGDSTDFHTLSPTVTAVVKLPGAPNDEYLVSEPDFIVAGE